MILETILLTLALSTSPGITPIDLSLEQIKPITIQQEQTNQSNQIDELIKYLSEGEIASSKGLNQEAKEFYLQGLEVYKQIKIPMLTLEKQARTELGKTYFKLGEYENMIEELGKAYMIAPHEASTMNNLAYGLAITNLDLESAEILSRYAVDLEPEKPEFNGTLGYVLGLRGKFEESINVTKKAIQNAITTNQDSLEFYYTNLINAHSQLGQTEQVQKYQNLLTQTK